MTTSNKKPALFSGIQPTGRFHIGNYLGMLKNAVELQDSDKYECYYCVVDLHSLTGTYTPSEKYEQILDAAASCLAVGIDPKKSVLFQQSRVTAHSDLMWILSTITPIGELERMTQYKDKAERQKANINSGLFTYPVLMAADIALYSTKFVPVGDDQDQHLELTRTLVRKFNDKFGETFNEPKGLHTTTPRVMSLQEPTKKMSKSDPAGCLFLDDSPEEIEQKVKRSVTDSGSEVKYDKNQKPGISNLLEIYSGLTKEPIRKIETEFAGQGYGVFKLALARIITEHFSEFRVKKAKLMADSKKIETILASGARKADKVASAKMAEVNKKVGLAL